MQIGKKSMRGVGRPRSFKAEVALRVVSQTFHVGGYAGTTLDDLARATGLQRPSLYGAFGSKKSMYLASLQLLEADITAIADKLDCEQAILVETIAALFSSSIDGYLSGANGPRGCLAVCTAAAEAVEDRDIRAALDKVLCLIDQRIQHWFEKAGYVDALSRARLVAATLHSISVRARAGQPREALEAMASDIAKAIC